MDLLKLFTREEPIAGLEISDSFLRVALLERAGKEVGKSGEALKIGAVGEKPLKEGIVVGGEIKNKDGFVSVLGDLLEEIKPRIKYAVVSIPADKIYSRLYAFPKIVSGEKLEETMKLTVGFQMPVKLEDVYLDWEKTNRAQNKNEVFLAAAPKHVINGYIEALAGAGLRTVAVEFYPISVARVIDLPDDKTALVLIFGKMGILASVIENKTARFSRFLPADYFTDSDSLFEEVRKIVDFYESDVKMNISEIFFIGGDILESGIKSKLPMPFSKAKITNLFSAYPKIKKDNEKWLIAVGAALRGIMPRSEDELVSLMPVGTEEAYENQKAVAFAEFISAIVIGLSVFFSVVFISVWILMVSVQQSFTKRLETLSSLPLPADAAEIEERAVNFNVLLEKVNGILAATPKWSVFIEELKTRIAGGIYITNLSVGSPADVISITGAAKNRTQLNAFKKSLEDSAMFAEVSLPITNIGVKENIPFSVSFRLKDPGILMQIKN